MRPLFCSIIGHGPWVPVSNLPLAGRIRAQCEKCGTVRLVRTV